MLIEGVEKLMLFKLAESIEPSVPAHVLLAGHGCSFTDTVIVMFLVMLVGTVDGCSSLFKLLN